MEDQLTKFRVATRNGDEETLSYIWLEEIHYCDECGKTFERDDHGQISDKCSCGGNLRFRYWNVNENRPFWRTITSIRTDRNGDNISHTSSQW